MCAHLRLIRYYICCPNIDDATVIEVETLVNRKKVDPLV